MCIRDSSMSADLLRPDLNIYIDISPEVSMERLRKGRDAMEMYETLDHQVKVYQKYEEAMEKVKNKEQIVRVAGSRSVEQIANDIKVLIY